MPRFIAIVAIAMLLTSGLGAPAHADWRAETGVFRVGLAENPDGASSLARYEPFRAAVSAAIGMPVEVLLLRDAPSLIDAQTSGRIEYAVLSSLGYAAAQEMCACLVPLAAPRSADGAAGIRSVLLVDGRQIENAGDLAGLAIGIGPPESLTGDLAPRLDFRPGGEELAEAGADLVEHASFEAARDAFLSGAIAGFFAWDYASSDEDAPFDGGLAAQLVARSDVSASVIWRSPHIPFGPHTVRGNVPADVREALTNLLVQLETTAPVVYDVISPSLAGGFVAVTHEDYAFATRIVRELASEP